MKKKLALALVVVLAFALGVGGTVAYLTANTQTVTNIFTVGNISAFLDEADVDNSRTGVTADMADGRDTQNTYKIIPGTKIAKDPTVHVKQGSEKCYVYIQITDELNATIANSASYTVDSTWTPIAEGSNIYKYNGIVDAASAQRDLPVFVAVDGKTITISGTAVNEGNIGSLTNKKIVVNAFLHQSDNVDAATAQAAAVAYFTPAASTPDPTV